MNISPRVEFYFKIVLFLLSTITLGALYKPTFISVDVAKDIVGMSASAFALLSGIHNFLTVSPAPAPALTAASSPVVPIPASKATILGLAALGLLVAFSAFSGRAEAAPKTLSQIVADINGQLAPLKAQVATLNGKVGLTGTATTDFNALAAKLQAISLADLKAAKDDADKTGDLLASACYAPLVDLISAQQSVAAPGQNTADPGANVPTTHLILDFQRGRDFRNAFQPTSPVGRGCAPLAQQVKLDIVTLVGQIAAGTISAATFGL